MTKSIDEQAREFVKNKICFNGLEYSIGGNTYDECVLSYIAGAKARDAQFMLVVNELREALKKTKSISVDMQESDMNNCCSTYSKSDFEFIADKSLIKADQMLKEMKL